MNVIVEKSSKVYQERMQRFVDVAIDEGIRFFVTIARQSPAGWWRRPTPPAASSITTSPTAGGR